jgi:hypothetical protein
MLGTQMRKLIVLALGLGALELLKREARRRGITEGAVVSDKIGPVIAWFWGPESKDAAEK